MQVSIPVMGRNRTGCSSTIVQSFVGAMGLFGGRQSEKQELGMSHKNCRLMARGSSMLNVVFGYRRLVFQVSYKIRIIVIVS